MCLVGDTFLMRSSQWTTTKHLHIVIAKEQDLILLVNLTSHKDGCENDCILKTGEHPFLDRNSMVNYMDAIITSTSKLKNGIGLKVIFQREKLSDSVLHRVQESGLNSRAISRKNKEFLDNYLKNKN